MFSKPQPTIEAAQALHTDELFNPAAVFQTDEGFVYGRIREMNTPPVETAKAVEALNGYRMVSYCDPLLSIWKSLPAQPGCVSVKAHRCGAWWSEERRRTGTNRQPI